MTEVDPLSRQSYPDSGSHLTHAFCKPMRERKTIKLRISGDIMYCRVSANKEILNISSPKMNLITSKQRIITQQLTAQNLLGNSKCLAFSALIHLLNAHNIKTMSLEFSLQILSG